MRKKVTLLVDVVKRPLEGRDLAGHGASQFTANITDLIVTFVLKRYQWNEEL